MARTPDKDFPENVESDRDILPLSSAGSKLPAVFFLIATVAGIILLVMMQLLGSNKRDVVEVPELFRPPATNFRLPDIQKAPDPVPVEKAVKKIDLGFDPLELERLRQIALLEEQKIKLARERIEAEMAERQRRRESSMVLMDKSEKNESITAAVSGLSAENDIFEGGSGFGTSNEVFENSSERFLRDAGNVEVVKAQAVKLANQETLITQGTFISGILETAVNSDLPGMVRAIADKHVYGRTGQYIVIPKGSRLIGRYQSGIQQGQSRVFMVWTRLERPDGVIIDLGSPGTDALGTSGLAGDIDYHIFQRFGASVLLSIVGPTAASLLSKPDDSEETTRIITSASDSFNRSAEVALENSINIPPTIRIPQGTKINIFVNRDLSFDSVGLPAQ